MNSKIISILILALTFKTMQAQKTIFKFDKKVDINNWNIIDDRVMGGISQGSFSINEDGVGVFSGIVSTANNGGFSSVRYSFKSIEIQPYNTLVLKIKGDGKSYQCRIKSNQNTYYSYIYSFKTNGDWQTIKIPLAEMYPSFRGVKQNLPNFNEAFISELSLLIGNKTDENFTLLIQDIQLQTTD